MLMMSFARCLLIAMFCWLFSLLLVLVVSCVFIVGRCLLLAYCGCLFVLVVSFLLIVRCCLLSIGLCALRDVYCSCC